MPVARGRQGLHHAYGAQGRVRVRIADEAVGERTPEEEMVFLGLEEQGGSARGFLAVENLLRVLLEGNNEVGRGKAVVYEKGGKILPDIIDMIGRLPETEFLPGNIHFPEGLPLFLEQLEKHIVFLQGGLGVFHCRSRTVK